jgi:3-deoxy-manno-octulosonate cytidylyltransferase (CMP-KDO synthetase)
MVEALFWLTIFLCKEGDMKMKLIGVIPARYASSRFPGKPLADILGKPMVWWVYQQAKKVAELDNVIVATDDERIAAVCREHDMPFVMTSDRHQTGTDRVAEVAEHIDGDVFINIQGDEPLIKPEMIRDLLIAFNDPTVQMATLKKEILDDSELNSPTIAKVVVDIKENALYFSRNVIPFDRDKSSEIKYYKHIGVYAYTKSFLAQYTNLPRGAYEQIEQLEQLRTLENGYKLRVVETQYESVAVDYPEHIALIEQRLEMTHSPPPVRYRYNKWLKRYSGSSSFYTRRAA